MPAYETIYINPVLYQAKNLINMDRRSHYCCLLFLLFKESLFLLKQKKVFRLI